ncbi:putative transcriptional regulatory protein y4xI [Mesorhizobium metallidurans STM 2683]|uniref:Transcriptional regulatory protein y4xI n=3 Tax=Mesorhizobium TaxID=68287 RepID=A0ABM9DK96_9HYPH|nr:MULTISPECIES: response regulator transcription factor [Mesorhizobium]CAH2397046.1 putative transcriptional regulatory protein y4xI [Mesorhizobium ventifaucium]CCV05825.1 putative transcriptional regulatory protein y4xI [Mesorhizobium metallidurans STM 2683]SIT54776.1 putative transcriptional regulatory protein y4xI [Mesorhizobium prunaredense]
MRTLFVDHHADLTRAVGVALGDSGFAVDIVRTLEQASSAFSCASYEVLLLELALPDGNGLDWLKQLRSEGHSVPALVLSDVDDLEKRIAIFNGGADDFLLKPVCTNELIARMRAVLRRSVQMTDPIIVFGNLHFDPIGRQVSVAGHPLTVARRELCILEHLLNRAGRIVPRSQLEDHLYSFNDEVSANALEVGIYRLRGYLSRSGATPRIKTVRGIGYILECD